MLRIAQLFRPLGSRWLPTRKRSQQYVWILGDNQRVLETFTNESRVRHMFDHTDQRVPKTGDVIECNGMCMNAQLLPSPCFKKFFQCSSTAGQGYKSITEFCHAQLAGVHILHDF